MYSVESSIINDRVKSNSVSRSFLFERVPFSVVYSVRFVPAWFCPHLVPTSFDEYRFYGTVTLSTGSTGKIPVLEQRFVIYIKHTVLDNRTATFSNLPINTRLLALIVNFYEL